MGQGLPVSAASCACAAAAAIAGAAAGGHCDRSEVGSCKDYDCLPTYGPTNCINGQCICRKDYCNAKMDDSLFMCRAMVGTCSLLNPCEAGHGGAQAVECVDGLCLCHSGFHADEAGVCQRGWWPPPLLLEESNGTARPSALAARPGARRRSASRWGARLRPAAALTAAVAVFSAAAAAWSAAGLMRRRCGAAACEEDLEPPYQQLPASQALAAG